MLINVEINRWKKCQIAQNKILRHIANEIAFVKNDIINLNSQYEAYFVSYQKTGSKLLERSNSNI